MSHAALIELARRSLRAPARAPSRHAQRAKRPEFWGETAKPPRIVPWGLLFTDPRRRLATREKWLLIRSSDGELLAYSQACTHLSCAVVPRIEEGVLHCPCHEGYFDLKTGRNIAGPPPRPLPKIELSVEGDDIYAIGIDERTV